jgi:hypothetical protein
LSQWIQTRRFPNAIITDKNYMKKWQKIPNPTGKFQIKRINYHQTITHYYSHSKTREQRRKWKSNHDTIKAIYRKQIGNKLRKLISDDRLFTNFKSTHRKITFRIVKQDVYCVKLILWVYYLSQSNEETSHTNYAW